jgi:hypothetical protein
LTCCCWPAGEKGVVPEGKEGAGKPYHFKGRPFYRIIDNFIDQAGEVLLQGGGQRPSWSGTWQPPAGLAVLQ